MSRATLALFAVEIQLLQLQVPSRVCRQAAPYRCCCCWWWSVGVHAPRPLPLHVTTRAGISHCLCVCPDTEGETRLRSCNFDDLKNKVHPSLSPSSRCLSSLSCRFLPPPPLPPSLLLPWLRRLPPVGMMRRPDLQSAPRWTSAG